MERKPHNPSGSIIDNLTGREVPRRGFLGAVLAGAAFVGAAACGRNSREANPASTTEAASGAPTSAAPTPEKTATPTPEAPRPKFTYEELNSGLREWTGLDDTVTRLSATSGEEDRREILYEFFGNEGNNGGLPYPELSGPKNARCNPERNAEVVRRATTELATVAALLADASVPEETKKVIISQYGELFMKSNSEEDPLAEIRNMVSKLKVEQSHRCNLFNMSNGKVEGAESPIPELPALIAVSSSDGRGECISKRRKGNSAASNTIQMAFVPKSLKPTVDSEGNITGYEVDEESAAKSPVCIIEMVPKSTDTNNMYSGLIWAVSNVIPNGNQTTIEIEGVEKPISSLRAK